MADTLREQILAILEAETDADPEPVDDDAEAPAEDSTEPVPDNQFDDAAIQAMVEAAVAEALSNAQPESVEAPDPKPTATRPPARTGRLTSPNIDKMTIEQRAKHYTDVVLPQQNREAELTGRR